MCGIAGFIKQEAPSLEDSKEILYDFHKSIVHRGPDHYGSLSKNNWGVLNNRLSIVDLAGGNQPFSSKDNSVHVTQNGEIYNFIELKAELEAAGILFDSSSDTEIILKGYEKYGIEYISKLNGMFAISILDEKTSRLHLVRDRLGVKPLYYSSDTEKVIYSSEIKTFFGKKLNLPKKINKQSLHNFLILNYVPQPATIFEGITHVEPGEIVSFDLKTLAKSQSKYWEMKNFYNPVSTDEIKVIDEIHETLLDATKIRLRSDVPMSAFLSGGIDSSLVCQYAYGELKHDCKKVFSIGFEDKRFDESYYFNYVAKKLSLETVTHFLEDDIISLWDKVTYHNDQPHGDISFIPTYILSKRAAQDFKVVLTGDGGDEAWGGYLKYLDIRDEESYIDRISLFKEKDIFNNIYQDSFKSGIDSNFVSNLFKETTAHIQKNEMANKATYFDSIHLLPGNNLVKPDRMSMASSLETRSPLLDYRLYELSQKVPDELKLKNGETKYLLKKLNERFFSHEHTYRTKQMFTVPVGEWFKSKLKNYLENILTSDSFKSRGVFKQSTVESMIRQHTDETANFTRELRAMVALEHWFRKFVD